MIINFERTHSNPVQSILRLEYISNIKPIHQHHIRLVPVSLLAYLRMCANAHISRSGIDLRRSLAIRDNGGEQVVCIVMQRMIDDIHAAVTLLRTRWSIDGTVFKFCGIGNGEGRLEEVLPFVCAGELGDAS